MEPDEALRVTKDAIVNGRADCFKKPKRSMRQAAARYALRQEAKRRARSTRKTAEQVFGEMIDGLHVRGRAAA